MGTINGPFAQRVDIILADLSSFLDALQGQPSFDVNRVVLVVATDASTQMPCCGQSLGYHNQQVSKLWALPHWKSDSCRAFWKGVHLLCVRKLRKNSAYAREGDVAEVLLEHRSWALERFLHKMESAAVKALPSTSTPRQPLGARRLSSVTPSTTNNKLVKPSQIKRAPSSAMSNATATDSEADDVSPVRPAMVRQIPKRGRASEPMLSNRQNVRSPIITRRRSGASLASTAKLTMQQQQPPLPKSRVPVASPIPKQAQSLRTSPPAPISGQTESEVKKPFQPKRAASASLLTNARPVSVAPRSVSASSFPTPTSHAIVRELAKVSPDSPFTPGGIDRSWQIVTKKESPGSPLVNLLMRANVHVTSTAVQTDEPEDPSARLLEIISTLKREKEELDRDISTVLARNTDLEMETSRLKKQKEALSAENEKRVSENARLKADIARKEEYISDLEQDLAETEEQLQTARKAIPLSVLQECLCVHTPPSTMDHDTVCDSQAETPQRGATAEAVTPVRGKTSPATTSSHVLRSSSLGDAPVLQAESITFNFETPVARRVVQIKSEAQNSRALTSVTSVSSPVRSRPRTPRSASVKRQQKKSFHLWKHFTKRRLFG